EKAKSYLETIDQVKDNENAQVIFRKAATNLVEELEKLAKAFEENNESDKSSVLKALVRDLKVKMEDKPQPQQSSPEKTITTSPLIPKAPAQIQGGTTYNQQGKRVPITVLPPNAQSKATLPSGAKPIELKVNDQKINVHFLGDSKTEFNEGAPLYLVPTNSSSPASLQEPPSYLAVPASEVLSLNSSGSENTRGLDRTKALAEFVATLPEAPEELVKGLKAFNSFKSEKDQQAIQTSLREYLGKTERSQNVTPFQREILARAVLDLESQRMRRMAEASGNQDEQTRQLLRSYEKPTDRTRSFLPALNSSNSSWDQLRQLEQHAGQAIEQSGEKGAGLVKQLSEALGYDVPLATIPPLIKALNDQDADKVRALASHGLHTKTNADGKGQIKRDDLQRVLEDLIIKPSQEKVSQAFLAQFPKVAQELNEGSSHYNQVLHAAIAGDQQKLGELFRTGNKLSPPESQRILEGAIRALIGQEFEGNRVKLDRDGQLDPATRKRLLDNPIAQTLKSHTGLNDEQVLQIVSNQTRNLLNQPAILKSDVERRDSVASLMKQLEEELQKAKTPQEREEIFRKFDPLLQARGEAGMEARQKLALALEAAQAANATLAQKDAESANVSEEMARAERQLRERVELAQRNLSELKKILSDPNFQRLSPRDQRSFFDRNAWREFFREISLQLPPDDPQGTHLSDNLKNLLDKKLPILSEAARQALGALNQPE
ncbi:MAG: hypothetical protein ACKN9V_08375, partial [Pseudomonadota bacterium]